MEPWGDELADIHHAVQTASIVNAINSLKVTLVKVLTKKRAKTKVYKPQDFLVWRSIAGKKKKTSAQMLQIVEILNEAFGGKDLRKKKQD